MNLEEIKIYRMTHIKNVPHVLEYGITHKNSKNKNPDFVVIGDASLINTRDTKEVLVDNGDFLDFNAPSITLGDFIPFYFGIKMPMLYVMQNGGNFVSQATPAKDIIYLVCSIKSVIKKVKRYYFSDGHATDNYTTFYDNSKINDLPSIIDWNSVKASYWGGQDNLNVKRKKQAEFLVSGDVPSNLILVGCYNEFAKRKLIDLGIQEDKIKVIPGAYLLKRDMIQYITGNILDSKAQALVNTVNTMGVMGKGIALQFKKAYPNNFKAYEKACKNKEIQVGKMFVTQDSNIASGQRVIINFPTKTDWRKPSEYKYIEDGLDNLAEIVKEKRIKDLAIPPLGAGNGGLKWEKVKGIIEQKLRHLDTNIYVYEPTAQIQEHLKKERVKLTDARALLLFVLYDLVKNGEYVSEFSSEKVCYFLQKFGAKKYFKLEFEPNFYGPYSGKVRFILNAINGSYLMGYSDMNKKPFEPLTLVADAYETVESYIQANPELLEIASKTIAFLRGFYSDFALELLSSMDYISINENTTDQQIISRKLEEWSDRKRSLFSNPKYLNISLKHLKALSYA